MIQNPAYPTTRFALLSLLLLAACGGGGGGSSPNGNGGGSGDPALPEGLFGVTLGDALVEIDPQTADLTPVTERGLAGHGVFPALAYDAAAERLLGITWSSSTLVSLDLETGEPTVLGSIWPEVYPGGATWDPVRQVLYSYDSAERRLVSIDPVELTATHIGDPWDSHLNGLAHDPVADRLYAFDAGDLYRIDPDTGVAEYVTHVSDMGNVLGLTFDPQTGELLVIHHTRYEILRIDPDTGGISAVIDLPHLWMAESLALVPETSSVILSRRTGQLSRLDLSSGQVADIGSMTYEIQGMTYDPTRRRVWGVDSKQREALSIDPLSGTVDASFPLQSIVTSGIAYDATRDLVHVTNWNYDRIQGFDPETWTIVTTVELPKKMQLRLCPGPAGTLYGFDSQELELYSIDPSNGETTFLGDVDLPYPYVIDIERDPATGHLRLVTPNHPESLTFEVDPQTLEVLDTWNTVPNCLSLTYDSVEDRWYGTSPWHSSLLGLRFGEDESRFDMIGALPEDVRCAAASEQATYALTWTHLWRIDVATGDAVQIAELENILWGLAWDPVDEVLYSFSRESWSLVRIDPETGETTPYGETVQRGIQYLAIDPESRVVHGVDDKEQFHRFDLETGEHESRDSIDYDEVTGLAFDTSRRLLLAIDVEERELLEIDPETLAVTVVGKTADHLRALALR